MPKRIKKEDVQDVFELNMVQKGILYHYLKDIDENLYNVQLCLELKGILDLDILRQALLKVQSANDVLRSLFNWERLSKPVQIILKECPMDIAFHDFTFSLSSTAGVANFLAQDRQARFDLQSLPFRVSVLKTTGDLYLLVLTHHHILFDGWSTGILLKELFYQYGQLRGEGALPAGLKPGYREILASTKKNSSAKTQAGVWTDYLKDYSITSFLPGNSGNDGGEGVSNAGKEEVRKILVTAPAEGLDHFAARHRITRAAVIYAAYGILLRQYNNTNDIIFGTAHSGRDPGIAGMERVMGNFVNTLPWRFNGSGDQSLLEIVVGINREIMERNEWSAVSYADIKGWLQLRPDDHLFDSVLAIENYPLDEAAIQKNGHFTVRLHSIYENTDIPLAVTVFFRKQLEIEFAYKSRYMSEDFAVSMANNLLGIIDIIISGADRSIDSLDLVQGVERFRLLEEWNATKTDYPRDRTIVDLLEEQVRMNAGRVAISDGEKGLTYRQLEERSNQLAHWLREQGAGTGALAAGADAGAGACIGVLADRSIDGIVAIMAILKAGGAYLPLDTDYPAERLNYMLRDSGCKLVLAQKVYMHLVQDLPTALIETTGLDYPLSAPKRSVMATDLAYIMYTSGSTGQPKGVLVTHRNVVRLVRDTNYVVLNESTRVLQTGAPAFDATTFEIWGSLLNGGQLYVAEKEVLLDTRLLGRFLETHSINTLWLTASLFDQHAQEDPSIFAPLSWLLAGGDALTPRYIQRVRELHPDLQIVNGYGPTENTTFSVCHRIGKAYQGSIPIGRPISNSTAYILDRSGRLQPIGVAGELCVGGDGVALGYLNREELTREKFVNSPFISGDRLYRTGDRARWLPDGTIEFLGRLDDQVKIRGFRIEPGEIAQTLSAYPGLRETVVVVREQEGGQRSLAAYYVSDQEIAAAELRGYLLDRLPDYMVPAYYVRLDRIPLTPNGKTDRKALPAPELSAKDDHVAPATREEGLLAEIWSELLGIDVAVIGSKSNFFELGGHSLRATLLVNQILKTFNVAIPLKEVFRRPDIAQLAEYIKKAERTAFTAIDKAAHRDYYKLSSAQKRLYFIYETDPLSVVYNMVYTVRIEGQVDKDRMQRAFRALIDRHESLRTSFELREGEPVQRIADTVDFEIISIQAQKQQVDAAIRQLVQPFLLNKASLLRVALIGLDPDEYLLMIEVHHIIADGVSQRIFMRDLMALYNDERLPDLRLQYRDFVEWEHSNSHLEEKAGQQSFWLRQFSELPDPLELPTDFPRPSVRSYEGRISAFGINAGDTAGLRSLAAAEGGTLFMVVLSVYSILLSRLSNQEDIVIGASIAGRQHADLENILGMFVNLLPLRNTVGQGLRYRDLLSDLKTRTMACLDNQAYPYEELVEALAIERNTHRNPLFDAVFAYLNFDASELTIPGLRLSSYKSRHAVSKFDMMLTVMETGDTLQMEVDYSPELFREETIVRLIAWFQRIISAILADADIILKEIDILTPAERHRLLQEFNNTKTDYPRHRTIVDLWEEQVIVCEGKIALSDGETELTYRQLDERSNQLAHWLREQGAGTGALAAGAGAGTGADAGAGACIGVLAERSIDAIVAIMAILKAGCAYLPLDTDYPAERLHYMLEDSGCRIVLTQPAHAHLVPGVMTALVGTTGRNYPISAPERSITATDLAYIMYTSGSTGKPKGVLVTHRNVVRLVRDTNYVVLNESTQILQTGAPAFDATTFEIWGSLLNGGQLHVTGKEVLLDAQQLGRFLETHSVNTLWLTASLFDQHAQEDPSIFAPLSWLLVGGDALTPRYIQRVRELHPDLQIVNGYGPTENTTFSVCHRIDGEYQRSIPIGRPIGNSTAFILDRSGRLQPIGVAGELCVGGDGVALGYLNREELTKEKFVNNPFVSGDRLYRTGDRARWLPDGTIEFLGRLDDQVKIRGFRIEPGEIAQTLSGYPGLRETVVVVREQEEGQRSLVAYYVSDEAIATSELREYLSDRLPDYMVPAYYVRLDRIPLTANGKTDRKALPDPELTARDNYVAPATPEEQLLARTWSKVLGMGNIGVTDNFFAAGGDSIKCIQICARVRSAGYAISVNDIFTNQTIRELAAVLKRTTRVSDQEAVTGLVSLTPIQQWFFFDPAPAKHHFNQSVLLHFPELLSDTTVIRIFGKLQEHHDALRMIFRTEGNKVIQENKGLDFPVAIRIYDLHGEADPEQRIGEIADDIQAGIDLATGPLMRLGLFHGNDGSRLLIVIHHLVVDGISWRILFEDIDHLYQQVRRNEPFTLPLKTDSYRSWSTQLAKYAKTDEHQKAVLYWNSLATTENGLFRDMPGGDNTNGQVRMVSFRLNQMATNALLTDTHEPFNTQINDILLTALLSAIGKQYGRDRILIDLEGHGREDIGEGIEVGRTVGWFTTIYPVLLENNGGDLSGLIKHVKETLRKIPHNGLDFLLGRGIVAATAAVHEQKTSRISFNYLGQFDTDTRDRSFSISGWSRGKAIAPDRPRHYDWEILAIVTEGQLEISLLYSEEQYYDKTIRSFLSLYKDSLQEIILYCTAYGKKELTPSDLTYKALPAALLDRLQSQYEIKDIYPLSSTQEGLLFHYLLDKKAMTYFQQIAYRMSGRLDLGVMEKSMNDLIARYDILRTLFIHDRYERPLQVVLKERKIDFRYKDIRSAYLEQPKDDAVQSFLALDRSDAFDLAGDALMRLTILHTATDEFEFIWSFHHILMDGWCVSILINEFNELYTVNKKGLAHQLSAVKPFSRYIQWLEGRDQEAALSYWSDYLYGYESPASLPTKDKAAALAFPYRLAQHTLTIGQGAVRKLEELSRTYGVTINTFLQAAWGILLGRYNNTNDVVFGSVVSGRPPDLDGIEEMVGLFINTIPVRVKVEEDQTIAGLIKQIQRATLDAEDNQYSALSEIQARSIPGKALMDHIMVFENYPVAASIRDYSSGNALFQDCIISDIQVFEQTNYDFAIRVVPGEEIRIVFSYNGSAFDAAAMESTAGHLDAILQQIVMDAEASVSAIEILTERERAVLLHDLNDTKFGYDRSTTVLSLFEQQVLRSPDQVALVEGEGTISYRQLNDWACGIARDITEKAGVKSGDRVAVLFRPSIALIASLLGIMKAGAAYIPLSPDLPSARNSYIFSDCSAVLLLAQAGLLQKDPGAVSFVDRERMIIVEAMPPVAGPLHYPSASTTPDDILYVIYTSGTTGTPKGVEVKNSGIMNMIAFYQQLFHVREGTSVSQVANIVFDAAAFEIWPCLTHGGSLHIAPGPIRLDPFLMQEWLITSGIEISWQPTAIAEYLLKKSWDKEQSRLRVMSLAGDRLNWFPQSAYPFAIYNLYGPTEDSVWSTWKELTIHQSGEAYSIGRPVANKKIYILGEENRLQPIGIPGELCIGGEGLARGYVNNPELTMERFVDNPFSPGERMYRTGDLARWLLNGEIGFLGRIDSQVKIRGYRIELGEIESQLSRHAAIQETAVLALERNNDKYLVAWYAATTELSRQELTGHLSALLPDYMIPAFFIRLDSLPLTANGKLNREALPHPDTTTTASYIPASGDIEKELVEIWSEVLQIDKGQVGITANFFDIGGHSINIIRLNNKINERFGSAVTVADMFRLPTIAETAQYLRKGDKVIEELSSKLDEAMTEAEDNLKALDLYQG